MRTAATAVKPRVRPRATGPSMLRAWLDRLLGRHPVAGVARDLAARMGAQTMQQGDTFRLNGTWQGMRCQVVLDGARDAMTVTVRAGPQNTTWEIRHDAHGTPGLSFVSTEVALTPEDAARLERLPMKVRLHVIEVVEAGKGWLRLQAGTYTLQVVRANLLREGAAVQAAIRLDVLKDLVGAAAKGL